MSEPARHTVAGSTGSSSAVRRSASARRPESDADGERRRAGAGDDPRSPGRELAGWQFVQAVAEIAASVESREPGLRDETDLPG